MNLRQLKHIFLFGFLYIFSQPLFAQYQEFRFTHLTTDNGLSQSNVTCILQDNKGYLWFGTFNGLNRYDGYEFKVFNYSPIDTQSISHNFISTLFEDSQGTLWVGTSDGLNRYNREANTFTSFKFEEENPNSISNNLIETILEDSKGRLWIGTRNGGLELFNRENESFIHHHHEENDKGTISSNRIRELFEDSEGNLWIAHWNGTIDILNNSQDLEKISLHQKKLTDSPITAIVESADKNIWIGTQGNGLYRLQYQKGELIEVGRYSTSLQNKNGVNSNIILCLMIDRMNRLWIGTEDQGIDILDIENNTFQYSRHDPLLEGSLSHNSVWSIHQDREGNIWVGTYAYGINLLTQRYSYFQHYQHHEGNDNCLSHNMVNSFVEDKNEDLWIATDGGGLNLFRRRNNKFLHYNSKNSNINTDVIVCLREDSRDRLWIGTWTDGLYQFDKRTKTFTQYTREKHGLGSNKILHICEDRKGGLWLSTYWGGLTYFNPDNHEVQVYNTSNSGLNDNHVRVVLQDIDGNLWVGTDVGLDFFDRQSKSFRKFKYDEQEQMSISSGFIHSIIQTADSAIWIGTTNGLNKFNQKTQTFEQFTTNDGLANNEIKCILEDEDGILWLSTNKGISQFDTKSGKSKNYDVSDGLQGNEFNIRSGLKTAESEIVFGGNNGFNVFRSAKLEENLSIPPVIITDFRIFNKPISVGGADSILQKHISETDKITLSYRHVVFSFDFAALNYISPEKNHYAYIMKGFESDWNYVGSNRTATYTNLDPGDYVFTVKASNNDGIWNEEGDSVKIRIEPPFWRTWWAYLIESLLLIVTIAFVANYFISRQRLRNALRLEHIELEKMYELDQMKTQFFSNISHEFHSPMTLILSPLEKLITSQLIHKKVKNSLKLIHRNVQRLHHMTNQLRDFQKLETGELQLRLYRGDIIHFISEIVNSFHEYAIDHHIRFQFNAEPDYALEWFDPDKVDKIIYNLLSNAFKFTPDGGEITVSASIISSEKIVKSIKTEDKADRYIEISFKDNGIGIPEDEIEHIFERFYHIEEHKVSGYEGSGIGLAFVYELIKIYQGNISVSSSEGQGSQFTIQIPVDEQYLEEQQVVREFNISENFGYASWDLPGAASKEFDDTKTQIEEKAVKNFPIILIVEDDKEIRDYIKNSLRLKYRIISAQDGQEGIKKAKKIIPDIIISDIKMPEVSGIQLCNQLKEEEKTSHVPIVLLTGFTSHEVKIEGLRKGADAYLSKPFNIDELEAQIVNLLESRKKLSERYSRIIYRDDKKIVVNDIDEKFLKNVLETVEKHLSDGDFNAENLSKIVGMSRMQLYRKLRGLTNQTVHEFIRGIRLKRAVQILKEKRMTITEVAYEVGFNDLTYFARCFRQQYKKSPSEFISEKS